MSILDTERHFISLYMYHVGHSEVPRKFHLWAYLSLLAAVVQDRIWVQGRDCAQQQPELRADQRRAYHPAWHGDEDSTAQNESVEKNSQVLNCHSAP